MKTFAKDEQVSWIAGDTSDGTSVERLIGTIQERYGRLDYAFNNGGAIGAEDIALIGDMSEESWRRTIDGYLTSVFLYSDATSAMIGSPLVVDGGFLA